MGKVEYTDNSQAWFAKLLDKADIAVGAASDELKQGIDDTMPGAGASKTGTGKNAKYTPSIPGNAPGVRDNRLKGSITSNKTGKKLQRSVGTNLVYARIHEFGGTINHPGGTAYVTFGGRASFVSASKSNRHIRRTAPHTITMPARPFMAPGLEASKKTMVRVFVNTLKRGMK